jgi:hypothetical protein
MTRKLKIEDLAVESFVVSAVDVDARGTVAAHARPPRPTEAQTACQFTCLEDDCQPTFGQSCLPCPTQAATCFDLTCFDCTV